MIVCMIVRLKAIIILFYYLLHCNLSASPTFHKWSLKFSLVNIVGMEAGETVQISIEQRKYVPSSHTRLITQAG